MISLDALDSFAVDHLQFEVRCSRCLSDATISTPPTDEQLFCAIEKIRALVMDGCIDQAWNLCQQVFTLSLTDPRPQLRVRLHKLFELIHTAESIPKHKSLIYAKSIREALRYSQDLAAFALDAFPEAYGIFTQSMMLFAFPEQTSGKDVVQQKRKELAADLVSTAKMLSNAKESRLSFLVRYLLLIFAISQPSLSPEGGDEQQTDFQNLASSILNNDAQQKDDPVMWQTDGPRPTTFNHGGSYDEADVQALPQRVNISRQDAIESLRFAEGDVDLALKNELGRVIINRHRFRMMVVEYCAARGIDVFETSQNAIQPSIPNTFAMLSSDQQRVVVPESSISPSFLFMFSTMRKLKASAESGNFDSFEETLRNADPSVLETFPALTFKVAQCRMMKHISRGEHAAALRIAQTTLGPLAKAYPEFVPLLQGITTILVYSSDVKFNDGNMRLTHWGNKSADVECSWQSCLSKDEMEDESTMKEARCQKTEQAMRFNKFLSEVIASTSDCTSADAVTLEAYKALESKYGEPALVQLFSKLVSLHEQWQQKSSMTDRFSQMLGIERLKGLESSDCEMNRFEKECAVGTNANSARMDRGAGRETSREAERRREERREHTILLVMEVLAMSRAEAIMVVADHPNENPQTLLDLVLSRYR